MEDDDDPLGAEDPDWPPSLNRVARAACISFWITVCIKESCITVTETSFKSYLSSNDPWVSDLLSEDTQEPCTLTGRLLPGSLLADHYCHVFQRSKFTALCK